MNDRSMGNMGVTVAKGESIDKALRRFKRKVDSTKVLKEYKERQEYTKPSIKKRLKKMRAKQRQREIDMYSAD
jgi:small subunit ribosomal protein S21